MTGVPAGVPVGVPCLAVDFGGSKVAIALFNESGGIDEERRIPLAADRTATSILEETAEVCRSMLTGGSNVVVGAVSPGVVQADGIRLAPNVVGWGDIALKRWANDVFPGRVVAVGNDVKAAAAAESAWGALRGHNPGLYLNLGTGIAAAIVIDGRVVLGANGASGEIGYNPLLQGTAAEPHRTSEHEGLLEDIVGARSIVRRAQAQGLDCLDASEVFAAMANVSTVSLLVDEVIGEVALQLRSIIHLVDPSRVVIGGGLSASAARFLPRLQERLGVKTGVAPEIVVARFATASSLHGARLLGLGATQRPSVEVSR
jgi:glucokinase